MCSSLEKKPPLVVLLRGGLGNQLFQFASSLGVAEATARDLLVESRLGFLLDRRYHRKYLLNKLTTPPCEATPGQTLETAIRLFSNRLGEPKGGPYLERQGRFVKEGSQRYYPELVAIVGSEPTILDGYWQSPRYFDNVAATVTQKILPSQSANRLPRDLLWELRDPASLVVGIRVYEETSDPAAHALLGQVTTPKDYSRALRYLIDVHNIRKAFVFSTSPRPYIDAISWPIPFSVVDTQAMGASDLDILWLLSQSPNHLLNNSSFYWWGAWLSDQIHGTSTGIKMASSNFLNSEIYPNHWQIY